MIRAAGLISAACTEKFHRAAENGKSRQSPRLRLAFASPKTEAIVQLLFVGIRPEDADPVLESLRQAGVVARASFVDTHTGIESLMKHGNGFDVIVVALRAEAVDYDKAFTASREYSQAPIIAWADDVQSDWLAEAYSSGAWAFALATYPAQASEVIKQACAVQHDQELLRVAQRSAEEVQQRESTLLAAARDPVAYVHEGMHIRANQAYLDFFAITDPEEIEGLPLLDLVKPSRAAEVKAMLRSATQGQEEPEILMDLQTVDGDTRTARLSMTKSVYEGEHCLQIALRPSVDASEPVVQVEMQGYQDLNAQIEIRQNEPAKAQRTALILLSVSDMQAFEGLGLAHARNFMSGLAARIAELCQHPVQVFDIDGRTLGVLIDDVPPEAAHEWLTEFREEIALHPIQTGDHSMRPLVFMGGVMLGPDWEEIGQRPFTRAEDMWRHSKLSRSVEWFDPAARDREEDLRRKELLEHTRQSLTGNGMLLAYRPILALAGESAEMFEVFIRMHGPNGNILHPTDFLDLAENNGLGPAVDDAAVRLSVQAIFEARRQKRDPSIVLSIGMASLLDDKFAYRLVNALDEKQVPRDKIIVQIPEDVARAHQGAVERLAKQKEELGFEMLVSRFMGEPESYDMLSWAGAGWVKLDESWTRDLPRNDKKQVLLKEIVANLNERKLASIADYVRDSPTMTVLFSAQVGYAAGDFLAPESQVMNAVE